MNLGQIRTRKETAVNTVQILLSTYNGERYLRAQLDSFLTLAGAEDVKLLIRDDGSTDGTRAILEEYRDAHGFEVIFGENVGLDESFRILFAHTDRSCSYFAYADQDDVWLPEKVARAVAALDGAPADEPVLYCARSHLTDEEGKIIGVTRKPTREPCFENAMVQNVCIGHTQVYNRKMLALLETLYTPDMFVMDHYAYLCAAAFGTILFDTEPVTLYRQHGRNAIGYGNTPFSVLKNRIRRTLAGVPNGHGKQLFAFREATRRADAPPLKERYAREIDSFLAGAERGVLSRLKFLSRTRAHRQGFFENLGFRVLYLFGAYNPKKKKKQKINSPKRKEETK
ncbi:MAG: glycosyltransferase [Clostridia bacterium]|nr:glycosyltransferase [Clostridia bacterium]